MTKTIKTNARVVTDSDLVKEVLGTTPKTSRPLVFYRALSRTPQVDQLVQKSSMILRPFSYAKPGIIGDIPLSYGRNDPLILRIIDHVGEWEDTGPYWGFGNNWQEAMNLDPATLKKITEGIFRASDLYKQVGRTAVDPSEIWQGTYLVNETDPTTKAKLLDTFKNDAGFLKELRQRAINFNPVAITNNPYMEKLNKKYFQYFNWARALSASDISDSQARKVLKELHQHLDKKRIV